MKKEKKERDFLNKPYYEGGIKAMRQFLREQLQYPDEARQKGVEGTVSLRYTIDHEGRVVDARVIAGIGHGCDEEAVRVVKLLRFTIEKNRKRRVRFQKTIQVHFRLPKKQKAPAKQPTPSTVIEYHYGPPSDAAKESGEEKPKSYSYTISLD